MTGQARFHRGVDLKAAYGQDVQAAGYGTVVASGSQGGYGTTVVIEHTDGTKTRYAHLSVALVPEGTQVAPGQLIGRVGSSGRSTGPHLHFEVIGADGQPLDPRSASNLGSYSRSTDDGHGH
jgi:murein DD-endopeptidase MepM/ murein hydrolase activator NlpD